MTVRVDSGTIHLEGRCPVEDAEPLLLALQDGAARQVDLSGATRIHMAVAQLLAAADLDLVGRPQDIFVADMLLPAILAARQQNDFGNDIRTL